jgi:hypothetical protein
MDLIHEFVRSINPLAIERQTSKGPQSETEERPGDCNSLSHSHSELLPDFPPMLNIMSSIISTREQNAIPYRSLGAHWLLQLKIFDLMAGQKSLR